MDKSKLIEDLITTRLLNGDVMNFIIELKQANVTPTEAATADLFGDLEIGRLVGEVLKNIDNQESLTPAVTELNDYLAKSDAVTASKGESKENFAMDKENLEEKIDSEVKEPLVENGVSDDTTSINDRVARIEEAMAKFSVVADQVQKMSDFMFAETEDEANDDEDSSDEDEFDACDSKVTFSEDGQVTIQMSKESYDKLKQSMANIRNFAEEHEVDEESDDMIAIPKSEYKQLMYDLGKAEARADVDSAKAYEENPVEDLKSSEEVCPECGKSPCECEDEHKDMAEESKEESKDEIHQDDIEALRKEIDELKAALASLTQEEKKVDAAEENPEEAEDKKEEKPEAESPKLSDEEKDALKEEIKEEVKDDVKEELISQKAAKPESLSEDEQSALVGNFSEAPAQNDTFEWLYG